MQKRSNNPRDFLDAGETALVEEALKRAEAGTSAQIKFVIVRHCWGHIRDKAARTFKKLQLHKVVHRNCVLILLVTANREFAILGDRGIHEKAGQDHWDQVRTHMATKFGKGLFAEGICEGIAMIAQELARYFPPAARGANEVADEIGYQP